MNKKNEYASHYPFGECTRCGFRLDKNGRCMMQDGECEVVKSAAKALRAGCDALALVLEPHNAFPCPYCNAYASFDGHKPECSGAMALSAMHKEIQIIMGE